MTIFLEAIQRLFEPQEVKNPKLVLIVGSLGLLSNIVGLVLFHDHSHSHGHSHAGPVEEPVSSAERGYAVDGGSRDSQVVSDAGGTVASVMPQTVLGVIEAGSSPRKQRAGSEYSRLRRGSGHFRPSVSRQYRDPDDIFTHPASLRQDIIQASRFEDESSETETEAEPVDGSVQASERSPLLARDDSVRVYSAAANGANSNSNGSGNDQPEDLHESHNHARPKPKGSGHSHDLNMRGVFLHVLGDALGNIGVIASALVIWLTSYDWRFYVDPGISLFITVIILCSAIPLCKAASRILLQAVPVGMSVDHILEDIQSLPGVISCHHLHVWQLSDSNVVSSLHIRVSHDIKGEGSSRYMELARQVRSCLHAYGIHSSTIQPEFAPDGDDNTATPPGSSGSGPRNGNAGTSGLSGSTPTTELPACLLDCGNECLPKNQCCPPSR
jgi:zinc transporter 1